MDTKELCQIELTDNLENYKEKYIRYNFCYWQSFYYFIVTNNTTTAAITTTTLLLLLLVDYLRHRAEVYSTEEGQRRIIVTSRGTV